MHLRAAPRHGDTLTNHTFLHANPTDNVHISPNGSIITIVGTRPSNHGAYRCMASNAYGVAQSVVNLSVHGEGRLPQGLCLSTSAALMPSSEPLAFNPASDAASLLGILPL